MRPTLRQSGLVPLSAPMWHLLLWSTAVLVHCEAVCGPALNRTDSPCFVCVPPCLTPWPRSLFKAPADSPCALYERARYNAAGIGHTFNSFNALVTLLITYGLTARIHYNSVDHRMRNLTEYFFGDGLYASPSQVSSRTEFCC